MNYLTEVKEIEKRGAHIYSLYQCICGVEKIIRRSHVVQGRTLSCGCHKVKIHTSHGKYKTDTYRRWLGMKSRCKVGSCNPAWYTDKGIKVCARWQKFETFYKDMGNCNGLELDRIDNDKGYSPENCRWTTRTVQVRNTGIKPHSSKYRGVGWHKQRNKWRANITIGNKFKHIGLYDTEDEAAIAWNNIAKTYEGFNLNKIE